MKTYIQEDFQICISVPLSFHVVRIFENLDLKLLGYLFIYLFIYFFEVLDIQIMIHYEESKAAFH